MRTFTKEVNHKFIRSVNLDLLEQIDINNRNNRHKKTEEGWRFENYITVKKLQTNSILHHELFNKTSTNRNLNQIADLIDRLLLRMLKKFSASLKTNRLEHISTLLEFKVLALNWIQIFYYDSIIKRITFMDMIR